MQIDYATRVKAGILIIVLFALLSNYQLLTGWMETDLSFVGRDDITLFEERFEAVKTKLPERAVVSYTIVGHANESPEDLRNYYLTQYTLTPRTVVKDPSQEFIVKIDPTVTGPAHDRFTVSEYEGGRKVFDYGNGISLIRNRR